MSSKKELTEKVKGYEAAIESGELVKVVRCGECDAIMDEAYYIAPDGSYIIRARKDGGE